MYSLANAGWADYPDSGVAMGALIGQLNGLAYSPNLSDVGHGAAYSPGSVAADAQALNFLGFFPDPFLAQLPDSFGQGGQKDMAAKVGAFFPPFRVAVEDFQSAAGLTVDGFIGPQTRATLKQAVDAKNAKEPGTPTAPSAPGVAPASGPAPGAESSSTGLIVGALAVAGVAAYAVYKYVL